MQKDQIKVGDCIKVLKVGYNLPQNMLNKQYEVTHIYDGVVDFIDENGIEWCGFVDVKYFDKEHGFHVEKVLTKTEHKKKVKQIEQVKEEKPFRMPTTSIRMFYRGQWKNCTTDDGDLYWEQF